MSKYIVVIHVTVEHEDDFEELDRMLQRASCIADYEYTHKFDLVDEGEPLNAQEGSEDTVFLQVRSTGRFRVDEQGEETKNED